MLWDQYWVETDRAAQAAAQALHFAEIQQGCNRWHTDELSFWMHLCVQTVGELCPCFMLCLNGSMDARWKLYKIFLS